MMNNKLQKLLNIVMVVLLILCFMQINSLHDELNSLRNTVNNSYSSIRNDIAAISSNVRNQMEEANNLLTDSGWSTGGLNIEDKTATVSCYVVPKEYSPKGTVAELICNEKAVPMVLENGKYVAEITIPLFENMKISTVQFTENGVIRTQQLGWNISPRYDLVPSVYMHYSGSTRQGYNGNIVHRTYEGHIELDFAHMGLANISNDAELVILVNGEEVERSKRSLEKMYENDYDSGYRTEMAQRLDVQKGDTIKMYMTVVDDNGWQYRSVLEDFTIGEDGAPIEHSEHYHAEADIYDANGNLLFAAYKE